MELYRRIRKNRWLSGAIIAAILFLIYFLFFRGGNDNDIPLIEVSKGSVIQAVTVTGKTKPAEKVDLAFEKSGRVTHVYVEVGDRVVEGQSLVAIDASELSAQLQQANGNVAAQQAKLDELKRGARPEDIRLSETDLENARQNLANDYNGIVDALNDAYAKSDDAVRKQTSGIFSNGEENPQLTFSTVNSQAETDAETMRLLATRELNTWKSELSRLSMNSSQGDLDASLSTGKARLSIIRTFLNRVMDTLIGTNTLSADTASTYKANITTALTSINTALTTINTQTEAIATQKLAIKKATDQLNLKLAGNLPETIKAQEAQVVQAQANASLIQAQMSKTILRAPLQGIVTAQDAKLGAIVSPNTSIVSIIFESNLEIEANVPEVDIGKISVGNSVSITLDALPGETFAGKVVKIDPAETLIDGVVNYKVTIIFNEKDPRFKSGLTANLVIETLKKENVLVLPQYAIIENDDGTFVRIPDGDTTKDIAIKTGIRSQDGNIEILSGVNEHEKVQNIGFKSDAQ